MALFLSFHLKKQTRLVLRHCFRRGPNPIYPQTKFETKKWQIGKFNTGEASFSSLRAKQDVQKILIEKANRLQRVTKIEGKHRQPHAICFIYQAIFPSTYECSTLSEKSNTVPQEADREILTPFIPYWCKTLICMLYEAAYKGLKLPEKIEVRRQHCSSVATIMSPHLVLFLLPETGIAPCLVLWCAEIYVHKTWLKNQVLSYKARWSYKKRTR